MPYSGISDPTLPEQAQALSADQRRQWLAVFEQVLTDTGDEGRAMAAAHAAVKTPLRYWSTIKADQTDEHRVGGYLVVYGTPYETDSQGDYFTAESDLALDWYDQIPVLVHHALDADDPRGVKIGHLVKRVKDHIGLYVEAVIDAALPAGQAALQAIRAGQRFWSSGAVSHLVRRAEDGRLMVWPIVEASITPTPAQLTRTDVQVLKAHLATPQAQAALEALLAREVYAPPDAGLLSTTDTNSDTIHERTPPMLLITPAHTRVLNGILALHENAFKAAYADWEAVKQGEMQIEEGAIFQEIMPHAQAMETVLGLPADDILKALMALYAMRLEQAAGNVEAEAETPAMEAEAEAEATRPIPYQSATPPAPAAPKPIRAAAAPARVPGYLVPPTTQARAPAYDPDNSLSAYVAAMANRDTAFLRQRAAKTRDGYLRRYGEYAVKALATTPDSAGGYLVPVEENDTIYGLFHDKSIFQGNNLVTVLPMSGKTLTFPRTATGVTVSWVGEGATISATDPTFSQETLVARKLAVRVDLTRELLEDAGPDLDTYLRKEIAEAMAEEYDRVILRGSGGAAQPLGLLNRAAINKAALNAAPTYAALVDAPQRIERRKVALSENVAWIVNPRDKATFRKMTDSGGSHIWTDGLQGQALTASDPPRLLGYRLFSTNQLDIDANSETEIFIGDWSNVVVGQRRILEFRVSEHVAFTSEQLVLIATLRMDLSTRRDEPFEILTDVQSA
jgi:HK97 family phage major capsid protein